MLSSEILQIFDFCLFDKAKQKKKLHVSGYRKFLNNGGRQDFVKSFYMGKMGK